MNEMDESQNVALRMKTHKFGKLEVMSSIPGLVKNSDPDNLTT